MVWDWKSSDATAATYVQKAKADFAKKHPGVTVEFVAQPFDQYYTLLGAAIQSSNGPDVMLFNGGGQIRDRVDALLPIDQYVAEDKQRLAGWDAFSKDGKIYAAPVTLQGHPIYYNKTLYEKAGLDPDQPRHDLGRVRQRLRHHQEGDRRQAASRSATRRASASSSSCRASGSGILTPQEYDDWIAGKRDWNSPNVKRIFAAVEGGQRRRAEQRRAPTRPRCSTTPSRVFDSGKAAHIIGLMSDIGHWKDFSEFLGADKVGVMLAPVVTAGATPEPSVRRRHRLRASRSGRRTRSWPPTWCGP